MVLLHDHVYRNLHRKMFMPVQIKVKACYFLQKTLIQAHGPLIFDPALMVKHFDFDFPCQLSGVNSL